MDQVRDRRLQHLGERYGQLAALFAQLRNAGTRMTSKDGPLLHGGKVGDLAADGNSFDVTFAGSTFRFRLTLSTSADRIKGLITCFREDALHVGDNAVTLGSVLFNVHGSIDAPPAGDVDHIGGDDYALLTYFIYKGLMPS